MTASLTENVSIRSSLFYDTYYNVFDTYDDITYTTQTRPYAFHSTYDDYSFGGTLIPSIRMFTQGILSTRLP